MLLRYSVAWTLKSGMIGMGWQPVLIRPVCCASVTKAFVVQRASWEHRWAKSSEYRRGSTRGHEVTDFHGEEDALLHNIANLWLDLLSAWSTIAAAYPASALGRASPRLCLCHRYLRIPTVYNASACCFRKRLASLLERDHHRVVGRVTKCS